MSIGTAAAQNWSPTSDNSAPVTLEQFQTIGSGGNAVTLPLAENIASVGVNASVSGSASGAVASVQLSGANAMWGGIPVDGIPDVHAVAINSGDIQAGAQGAPTTISFDDKATLAAGASTQISTTGATAAFSATGAGTADFIVPATASIDLTATNTGDVINRSATIQPSSGARPELQGAGSSVSSSATGAAVAVNLRAVNANSFGTTALDTIGAVSQEATNIGVVDNRDYTLRLGAVSGSGASAGVGATGVSASVSLLSIDSTYGGLTIGNIGQTVSQEGNAVDTGGGVATGPVSGIGASVSRSVTGAAASVGETMIGGTATGSTFGTITQAASLDGTGFKARSIGGNNDPSTGIVSGAGASVGASVGGARVGVSSVAIGSTDFTGSSFGAIDQTATTLEGQGVAATNTGSQGQVIAAGLSGSGASASISASGAAASVGSTMIDSDGVAAQFSAIDQEGANAATVWNFNGFLSVSGPGITGSGAAAQIGVAGASTSVGMTNIGSTVTTGAQFVGGITAEATNSGDVNAGVNTSSVTPPMTADTRPNVLQATALSGTGSSAGITVSGASASVSETVIAGTQTGRNEIRGVVDLTASNSGTIVNANSELAVRTTANPPEAVDITGLAASARIGAVGASTNMSSSVIEGVSGSQLRTFGPAGGGGPTQMDAENTGSVSVTGANLTAGSITGVAASAGISATGASSAVSGTVIDTPTLTQGMNLARLGQAAQNDASISVADSVVSLGDLSGTAASASVGVSGAVASVAFSGIGNGMAGSLLPSNGDAVTQNVVNNGNISVDTSPVAVGTLSGNASSASISARGASGSIAVSSIESATQGETTRLGGNLVQDITNNGNINASGNISAAGVTGVGASIAVSAVGAAANVSVSSINDATVIAPVQVAGISQNAVNTAPVVTAGSVNVGGAVSGLSSSVSVSAVGASSVVSFNSIATP
ncbi:MAG: beta strand repeat-containing protein [Roseinatronobacter sp.]